MHLFRGLLTCGALLGALAVEAETPRVRAETQVPMVQLTQGTIAHWFGYYDKFQFDPSDRYVLGMQVGFEDRSPTSEDAITLGYVDREKGNAWTAFGTSRAWSWQQGCMLQWLPGSSKEVIFNDRQGTDFVAVVQNVFTGERRVLPRPVYTVSPDGTKGLSINFARIDDTRPGYGYKGGIDAGASELIPLSDGIFLVDLQTGASERIVEYAAITEVDFPETPKAKHWLNHLLFNPDGTRFIFLHRAGLERDGGPRITKMHTANLNGSGLFTLANDRMVSHFIWRDPEHLLAWGRDSELGDHFFLYRDQTGEKEIVGPEVLTKDGHCTYSPDGKWILLDTYPDQDRMQSLFLYHVETGKRHPLGRFYQEKPSDVEWRCDLHPRWSRDGRWVCIDSKHEDDQRQMYLLDVEGIVGEQGAVR